MTRRFKVLCASFSYCSGGRLNHLSVQRDNPILTLCDNIVLAASLHFTLWEMALTKSEPVSEWGITLVAVRLLNESQRRNSVTISRRGSVTTTQRAITGNHLRTHVQQQRSFITGCSLNEHV